MTEKNVLVDSDPLEPWESDDSRSQRDAWREVRARVSTSGTFQVVRQNDPELAKSLLDEARLYLARDYEATIDALRRENALLRADASSRLWSGRPPLWLSEAKRSLLALIARCNRDDWDGEGARRLMSSTWENALVFLTQLPLGTPRPDIEVDADGHVTFDWQLSQDLVFTVIVDQEANLHFAGLYGDNRNRGVEKLGSTLPPTIAANIARVLAEQVFRTEAR